MSQQQQQLYDFTNFDCFDDKEKFSKEFIERELAATFLLVLSNPNNHILKLDLKLVYSMYNSEMKYLQKD